MHNKLGVNMYHKLFYLLLPLILGSTIFTNANFSTQSVTHNTSIRYPAVSTNFITRAGTQLLYNGHPFRFAGANIHWLPLGDSTLYTSQFQINDALDAAKEMGLTIVRSHDLGVSTGCSNCIEPSLGVFNATALLHDDYVIQAAHARGIHLIIPLTDNYHYPAGGKHNFTDWRGISDENQFFTNTQVILDFEDYIRVLLNHVNIYTGVAYKNDPTIMAWETGNELYPTNTWTRLISTFIKSIDPNHLIIDGSARIAPNATSLTNVDILSDHYYPKNIAKLMKDAALAKQANKAFIVGEFDWNDANGGDSLSRFLSAIQKNNSIAGDAFWELWPHDDQYGYVPAELKYMLHYPGDSIAMRTQTQLLRTHAYNIRGMIVPPAAIPGTPVIDTVLRSNTKNVITWRGTAIAASYTVERSTVSANGPWQIICMRCATDNGTPWTDPTPPTSMLWYRVIPYNLSGVAGSPSASYSLSPRIQSMNTLVDDLNDWSKTYQHSDHLGFDTIHASYMNGDTSRACRSTATHEWITWKQDDMISFQATSYFWPYETASHFSFYISADNVSWMPITPTVGILHGTWSSYVYTLDNLPEVNYVKIVWNNTNGHPWSPELGQVIIGY